MPDIFLAFQVVLQTPGISRMIADYDGRWPLGQEHVKGRSSLQSTRALNRHILQYGIIIAVILVLPLMAAIRHSHAGSRSGAANTASTASEAQGEGTKTLILNITTKLPSTRLDGTRNDMATKARVEEDVIVEMMAQGATGISRQSSAGTTGLNTTGVTSGPSLVSSGETKTMPLTTVPMSAVTSRLPSSSSDATGASLVPSGAMSSLPTTANSAGTGGFGSVVFDVNHSETASAGLSTTGAVAHGSASHPVTSSVVSDSTVTETYGNVSYLETLSTMLGSTGTEAYENVSYLETGGLSLGTTGTEAYENVSYLETGGLSLSTTGTEMYENVSYLETGGLSLGTTETEAYENVSYLETAGASLGRTGTDAYVIVSYLDTASTHLMQPTSARPVTAVANFTGRPKFPTDYEVCNTSFCTAEGASLSLSLSTVIKPCEDFYTYVCQKMWPSSSAPFEYTDSDSLLAQQIEEKVRAVLDGSPGVTSSPLVNLWRSCQPTSGTMSAADLQRTFVSLGFDPVRVQVTPDVVLSTVADVMSKLTIAPLLFFEMNRDPKDNAQWIIALDEPDILVSSSQIKSNEYATKNYFYSMACAYVQLLFGQPDVSICGQLTMIGMRIAKESTLHIHPARRAMEYKTVLYPQLDHIHTLLHKVMGPTYPFNSQTRILLKSPIYVQKTLKNMLESTPIPLYNYVGFHIMVAIAPFVGASGLYELALFTLTGRVWKAPPKWRVCLHLINRLLPALMAMAYQKPFLAAQQFQEFMADVMAEEVRNTFLDQIPNARFLDAWTRNVVLMKFKNAHIYSFFPLHLSIPVNVANYTNKLNTAVPSSNNPLQYFLGISEYVSGSWKEIGHLHHFHQRWKGSIFDTSCQYVFSENAVVVPVGLFNISVPTSTKEKMFHIPRIAPRIAKCLFRAILESAAFYNPNEVLWTEYSSEEYQRKLKCLSDQYKYERHEMSEMYSVVEDNAAIRVSYQVFQDQLFTIKYFNKDYRLLGLTNVTSRELFFIYYARSYCQKLPADARARNDIENRVNVPLKNSKEFSRAFSCGLASDMNPVEKCHVWQ